MRVVVMGVAGCGKTSVGERLAAALGCPFFDADDFHPQANVDKMSRGEPLTDEDRAGWLRALADLLARHDDVVLACSALKAAYRRVLATSGELELVHLEVSPETAADRLRARPDHYMPASLVASQFAILERPDAAVHVDAEAPLEDVCAAALTHLGRA